MVLYLHSIYNGGNNYFSIDTWDESEQCFHPIPAYRHIDGATEIAKVYAIAERLGARKLVLDF